MNVARRVEAWLAGLDVKLRRIEAAHLWLRELHALDEGTEPFERMIRRAEDDLERALRDVPWWLRPRLK